MKRTPNLDKKEKEAVEVAEKVLCNGGETGNLHGFECDGIWIVNPLTSENGMETVNPEEYYSQQYVKWYNSL